MKKLFTLFLLSTALISNAQRAMFGGHNNYTTLVGPIQTPSVISAGGRIWMDRNLGATQVAISSTDVASYGDLYQWGRGKDGYEKRTSGTTINLSSTDIPGNVNFILAQSDWRSPQNNTLWQGVNGTNNPCPAGFRLPTAAEWTAEMASWSSNDANGALASSLKLPMAGGRDFSNGSPMSSHGYYWSYGVYTGNVLFAKFLDFTTSNNAYVGATHRAFGLSVRCIKD